MHKEKIKPTHLHMYEQQIIIIFYPYIIHCFYFVPNREFFHFIFNVKVCRRPSYLCSILYYKFNGIDAINIVIHLEVNY